MKRPALKTSFLVLILAGLYFALNSLDFYAVRVQDSAIQAPAALALVALIHAALISYLFLSVPGGGWKWLSGVFLLHYGVSTAVVAVETVYLADILPLDLALSLLFNGAIASAIFTLVAALVYGKLTGRPSPTARSLSVLAYLWRLALCGLVWVILFVAAGLLVFQPLAAWLDPAALAFYADMPAPPWILPFQAARGIVLAALLLPLIRRLPVSRLESALACGLSLALLMGSNLILPAGLPPAIQFGHWVEVTLENLLFGVFVALLFARLAPGRPAAAQP